MAAEILAPAGGFEALTAAVRAGADAVYFGIDSFHARRSASNFDGDALFRAAEFCHSHGVRFHITLNTLVGDWELPAFQKTVRRACEANADALIVQDLGAARLVREMCPEMELHASTQMSVGTLGGLEELAKLGFTQAVLPRELSKAEIRYLCQNSPLELEVFVHGALCMCVSGQCLLSAMLGSRSGNRGLCAQPCRLPFAAEGGTGADLSLKDLSLIAELRELSRLGVTSFKIEGRMKRPEYVAAAVTACRESLTGAYSAERADELQALFSRSGFTEGYYADARGRAMFGKREKEDVTAATAPLLKKYERIYEKERAVFPVDFRFTARLGEAPSLIAESGGQSVLVIADTAAEAARNTPLTEETVRAQLEKCGGTVFFPNRIECALDKNIRVPLSALNALRRRALDALSEKRTARTPPTLREAEISVKPHTAQRPETYLCFRNPAQIPDGLRADRMFLPITTAPEALRRLHADVFVPRGIFGNAEEICEMLRRSGAAYALCNTLDAVAAAKKAGVAVVGGPSLNLFNSISLEEAQQLGIDECVVSYELTAAQIAQLGGEIRRGAAVYGRTPLMLTRNCPVRNGKTCAECQGRGELTDRKGVHFPVRCANGFSELFNSRPTYMADRLQEIRNVDFYFLDFTTETAEEAASVLRAYETGAKPTTEFTRGLFYRGVL